MHVARGGQGRGRCSGWVGLGLLLAVASGCTPREPPSPAAWQDHEGPAPECAPSPAEPLPVITTLRTRDHEVTVYASDDGLRFTVALADGALLGRQLSAHEFEHGFPALHRRFDATFAGEQHWLDASIEGLRMPQASAFEAAARDGLRMPQASAFEAAARDGRRMPSASDLPPGGARRLGSP